MFKSFQDTSALQQFHSFPNLNMQQATSAYGFSGVTFWLDAAYGLNTQTNLGAVSSWQQRVGGGTFVQASAGSQPRLILSDANYNNLPSVESISGGRSMGADIGLKMNGLFTVAIVSKVNTQQNINGLMSRGTTAGINDGGNSTNINGFGYNTALTTPLFQGTTESTAARIKIMSSYAIVVNGSVENTSSGTFIVNELTRVFGQAAANEHLIGTIAEIIGFNYAMTSDEAIALSNNINQKYAIY